MAIADSTQNSFKQRLLAVLDYDGISPSKRVAYLANACGVSHSTARRMIKDNYCLARVNGQRIFDIADGLNVHYRWIYDGLFNVFEPRTARIQLVMLEDNDPAEADALLGSIANEVPGEPTYGPVGEARDLSLVILVEQHRRLTEWGKNKNLRFMIRLINKDPKAIRLLHMCSRGQITKQQIFHIV
jgi:hypothetical protein